MPSNTGGLRRPSTSDVRSTRSLGEPVLERVTVPTLFPPPTYSHATVVEAGTKLAFLAGAVPLDAEGKVVGAGDAVRQAEQVLANLGEQLRAVGSDLGRV